LERGREGERGEGWGGRESAIVQEGEILRMCVSVCVCVCVCECVCERERQCDQWRKRGGYVAQKGFINCFR